TGPFLDDDDEEIAVRRRLQVCLMLRQSEPSVHVVERGFARPLQLLHPTLPGTELPSRERHRKCRHGLPFLDGVETSHYPDPAAERQACRANDRPLRTLTVQE